MPNTFDPATVAWVLTPRDLAQLKGAIEMAETVVMDLETTGLDEHAVEGGKRNGGVGARVVLASFTLPRTRETTPPTTWVVPLSHPDSPLQGRWRTVLRELAETVQDSGAPVIGANIKFDCRWIRATAGTDLTRQIYWDSMVSSHLLDENSSTKLKERAPATFGVDRWDDFDLSTPGAAERVPMFDLGMYAARDTYWTWQLSERHQQLMYLGGNDEEEPVTDEEREAARLGVLAVWCAMPMVATLGAMEQRGIMLDREWVDGSLAEHRAEVDQIHHRLVSRYASDDLEAASASFAPTSLWFGRWADAAVAAGDLHVAELTPTGRPRWSKTVLVRQSRRGSEVATDLLALRSHTKKIEYLASWLTFQAADGAIHTTYNPGRVVTGRLSSDSPNMQQVTASLKPAFVPRPRYLFADLDYSQIELRVAAFISRCKPMIEAFQRGDDLHNLLGAKLTGKAPADVTGMERQAAKSANFGLLYQMSAAGFRDYAEAVYDISFTIEEATTIHAAFYETWDGIAEWHARVSHRLHQTGQVVSPIGRVRRLPGVWDSSESYAGMAERAGINSPVQGFGSDLMQMAAAWIAGMLPGTSPVPDAYLVATVHDEILVEVPEDDWERPVRECQRRMVAIDQVLAKMGCHFDVPLTVEVHVGTRWGLSDVAVLH